MLNRLLDWLFLKLMQYQQARMRRLGNIICLGINDREPFCHEAQWGDYGHMVEDPQRIVQCLLEGDLAEAESIADRFELEEARLTELREAEERKQLTGGRNAKSDQ